MRKNHSCKICIWIHKNCKLLLAAALAFVPRRTYSGILRRLNSHILYIPSTAWVAVKKRYKIREKEGEEESFDNAFNIDAADRETTEQGIALCGFHFHSARTRRLNVVNRKYLFDFDRWARQTHLDCFSRTFSGDDENAAENAQEITRRPAGPRKVRATKRQGKGSRRHTVGETNYRRTRVWRRTLKGGTRSNECTGYLVISTWVHDRWDDRVGRLFPVRHKFPSAI